MNCTTVISICAVGVVAILAFIVREVTSAHHKSGDDLGQYGADEGGRCVHTSGDN